MYFRTNFFFALSLGLPLVRIFKRFYHYLLLGEPLGTMVLAKFPAGDLTLARITRK